MPSSVPALSGKGHGSPDPVVIWGAGAIGGTIGAYLVRAGHEVRFVDTAADHVAAMNRDGLRIEGSVDSFTVRANAVLPEDLEGRFPLIILAVKAHYTEAATKALEPFLSSDGAVVSCQNGLNEITIAEIVGAERTVGAFVNFLADYLEPGRILYGGRGAVVVGEMDGEIRQRTRDIHALLRVFDRDAELTDNIAGYLWGKAAYGTLLKTSALADAGIVDYIRGPAYRLVLLQMIQEVLLTAQAERIMVRGFNGFDPTAFLCADADGIERSLDGLADYNGRSAKTHSGVWRDLVVRKRQTDVAAQVDPVRAVARRHGIATPALDALVETIGEVERGERPVGEQAFARLQQDAEIAA